LHGHEIPESSYLINLKKKREVTFHFVDEMLEVLKLAMDK